MVKVVVGYKLKVGTDIQPALLKLRSYAMTFPGFISAENLASAQEDSVVAIIYTWEDIKNWKAWENASIRKQILKEVGKLLQDELRVNVYRLVPTTGWSYDYSH